MGSYTYHRVEPQLIMTTQVTTKISHCKGLKVDLFFEDAMDDFGDISELEASRMRGLSLQKATLLKVIDTSKWIGVGSLSFASQTSYCVRISKEITFKNIRSWEWFVKIPI